MDQQFLNKIKQFFNVENALPVGSGLVGLYLILKTHNVKNKQVLIPALTGWTVPIAVTAAGGIPVLIDLSSEDCNINTELIKKAINKDVRAIIAVNGFGYPVNLSKIKEIVEGKNCLVIEDACHAYGGFDNGQPLGSRTDIGVISFGHGKPIEGIGGGMIVTDDNHFADRIMYYIKKKEFEIFKDLKNQIKIKCIIKRKYLMLRNLSNNFRLLHYNMNNAMKRQLPQKWEKFTNELNAVKKNLYAVHRTIKNLKGLKEFNYTKEDWLPWRYSFLIEEEGTQRSFEKISEQVGLRYSRLYPTLQDYYPDLMSYNSINVAKRIAKSIYNFNHLSTIQSTDLLLKNLDRFANEWNRL